ncbi:NAD(P)H-binding protein [Hymenobacter psoromatis]|uniref:NmrA family NAD(P)-binding protein n=1 Tax=Hymenobacter psoromatis TaxID=1484116 RepID=UPI001CBC8E3B|nr:NAD(P)H-binding protein [Hymenobacter psoromatis]
MKIVITGSLGHVGQPLAENLVGQGHAVTVISRSADRRATIAALGATAAIGSVQDADFLAATFAGAGAVFVMIPPNFGAPDPRAYYQQLGGSYAQAIGQAGVPRVVHLSSWGADLSTGTGFILGSHDVEGLLNALPNVALTHLRPGYFYYNLNNYFGLIRHQDIMGANYGGQDKLVLVHPTDIAAAAAAELTAPDAAGRSVRYVASDERTPDEVARVLGAALAKPALKWVTFPDEQVLQTLEQRGVPPHIAALSVDLGNSIHSGALGADYERHRPTQLGKIKLEDFAPEFAAAYERAQE